MKTARMILVLVLAAGAFISVLLVMERRADRQDYDAVRPYLN